MIAADDANEDDRQADERRQQTQDAVEEDRLVILGNSIRCTCFFPQGQIFNSSALELKHTKPSPHLALNLSITQPYP